jgi:hypothetical protein
MSIDAGMFISPCIDIDIDIDVGAGIAMPLWCSIGMDCEISGPMKIISMANRLSHAPCDLRGADAELARIAGRRLMGQRLG